MSDGLSIAMQVRKAMAKKKRMAMGGDVHNEHDQDLMEPMEADEPLMRDSGKAMSMEKMSSMHDKMMPDDEPLDEQEMMMAKGGMNEKLHPMAKYARGGMHMDPMHMVKAIRMKKMAAGGMYEEDDMGDHGAIEANEALGKNHKMDAWLSSGDSDIAEETADPFEKRKARIRSALMSMDR